MNVIILDAIPTKATRRNGTKTKRIRWIERWTDPCSGTQQRKQQNPHWKWKGMYSDTIYLKCSNLFTLTYATQCINLYIRMNVGE